MIKRLLIILVILLVTSCGVNKKDLYKLTINDEDIYVGHSKKDSVVTSFSELETDDEGVITKIVLYPSEYDSSILINDVEIDDSISVDTEMYKGYIVDGQGVIDKSVSGKTNRIIFNNNIFNDNLDELDHITILFE